MAKTQHEIILTERTKAKPSAIREMLAKVYKMNSERKILGLPPVTNLTIGEPHLPPNPIVMETFRKNK